MSETVDLLVIGNGIAGISAALEFRRLHPTGSVLVVSDESSYFYSRPALMYVYLRTLKLEHTYPYEKKFWRKQNIALKQAKVIALHPPQNSATLSDGSTIHYRYCLLATGAIGRELNVPGYLLAGVQTFTNLNDLAKLEAATHPKKLPRRAIIIGGGLIGIEVCEMLRSRHIPVTFLVREPWYFPLALSETEGRLVEEEIRAHGAELWLQSEAREFQGSGKVERVITQDGRVIEADLVVVTIGVTPRIDLAQRAALACERGILVNEYQQTAIENIFAAGDCAEVPFAGSRRLELLWYTGERQGKTAGANIARLVKGEAMQPYTRDIWFNSAKFFTLDWHNYGDTNTPVGNKREFVFRFPGEKKVLRLVYGEGKILGFSSLGLRLRDKICRNWIAERRSVDYIIEHLKEALFDPEFFKTNLKALQTTWAARR